MILVSAGKIYQDWVLERLSSYSPLQTVHCAHNLDYSRNQKYFVDDFVVVVEGFERLEVQKCTFQSCHFQKLTIVLELESQ